MKPLDAVQWALYYPAIIGYHRNQNNKEINNQLQEAEHLLSVGQAEEALDIIDSVLASDPNNSNAIALKSIIAVVQNDKERALELALQAVEQNDLSVPAWLALSYAQQASFEIDTALASVRQAVILDPQNALIWARLAELQMSLGRLEQALEAAQEAVNLNPTIAKTQTVLGFAYLLQINTADAKIIFHEAILLDQADPMPRLGLGLALIREGQLEAGRIELEIAASLDPANSLIRSYLGKAYFEEKRYATAGTQFELAKERDPNDPTPWFYDAIQKQTQNRPVEALRDIQKSIELNDNRAVYRSKLLLDQDQAGRGSSLARIYDNLGFERRAIMETAKSLSYDPGNHSAHRFLSDTYANTPRHEIARVSELLQAQLLQPINVNPVQPHAVVPDLNIITNTGPFSTGFNEFAPLMERNKPQMVASGVVGNQGTLGNEMVFSTLYDRTSVSLGQFHYETNGFRPNNDQSHNIYNAFIQHAFTPKLNIQAELRTRSLKHGDIERPRNFSNTSKTELDEDIARIGARYAISPHQDIIISGIYADNKIKFSSQELGRRSTTSQRYQIESQYLFQKEFFNFVAGGGASQFESDLINSFAIFDITTEQRNAYFYSNWNIIKNATVTLGFSFDSYKVDNLSSNPIFNAHINIERANPKLGLQYDITKEIRFRAAVFEAVKMDAIGQQSLQPTQVSGFNQFFDDPNGTRSRNKGIGLDAQIRNNLYIGAEAFIRNLKIQPLGVPGIDSQKEQTYRAYLYTTINSNWSATGEFKYENFSRREDYQFIGNSPTKVQTLSTPIKIQYFNPNGFFASILNTFVFQDLDDRSNPAPISIPNPERTEGKSSFFLLDLSTGYRFPSRRGLLSFEVKNLLDENFFFRSSQFQNTIALAPIYIPDRRYFARLTLNF
ncbi:MAG TPA: tetratricopeptide repeat protein [Nitrosomonas nitrosa]|nr:tetratricopeptide repeat protein [Nitrosomonas nitrosa]